MPNALQKFRLKNLFSLKRKDAIVVPQNRLAKFKTYDEYHEERIFFAYRPLMYLGMVYDIVFIYGDYFKHGFTTPFYILAFARVMATFFTGMIVVVTYSDLFKKHRGLWILLFGNTSLLSLLTAYTLVDPRIYFVPYTWVYYMLSTIVVSALLSNKAFLIVHYSVAAIVVCLMASVHINEEEIGIFVLFIAPVLLYLWAIVAAVRMEAKRTYAMAYQNHIYMTLDTLSQLLNRREFYLQSLEKWKEAHKSGGAISFIMLDIDHFKKINDTYGHDCGDKVIKSVCDILLEQTREGDIVGRLGGEEFGVILPFTAAIDAAVVGEQIRKMVESHRIEFEGHIISVTISVGVCEKNEDTNDLSALVSLGDKRLYTAKNGGRNRVVAE